MSNTNAQNANDFLNKAIELENVGNIEDAVLQLDKALEIDPTLEQALLNRAIDLSILGEFEAAIADLDRFIDKNPIAVEPYVWRAEYKRMLERYDQAMIDVDKALAIKKPSYSGTDIIGPKEIDFSKVFSEGDNYNIELEFIVYERGANNYHLGNYEQALKDLEFAKQEEDTFFINTHYYMGLTLHALGRTQEGCEELQKAYESGEEYAMDAIKEYCK